MFSRLSDSSCVHPFRPYRLQRVSLQTKNRNSEAAYRGGGLCSLGLAHLGGAAASELEGLLDTLRGVHTQGIAADKTNIKDGNLEKRGIADF